MFESDIKLKAISPREIRLSAKNVAEQKDDFGNIIKISTPTGFSIKVGDTTRLKKAGYKVNLIERIVTPGLEVHYNLRTAKLTTASIFITPLLGVSRKFMFWDSHFVNAFVGTEDCNPCIALLYRYSGDIEFSKYEDALCGFRTFVKHIDPDPNHVLFIFNVPEECSKTYNLLRAGKYSEIGDLWKLKILGFHGFRREGHVGKILYKDSKLKAEMEDRLGVSLGDAELHSRPDMRYEIFDPEYYAPSKPFNKKAYDRRDAEATNGTDEEVSLGGTTPGA